MWQGVKGLLILESADEWGPPYLCVVLVCIASMWLPLSPDPRRSLPNVLACAAAWHAADGGDVMLPPAGFQGSVDKYPNYAALCPPGEYVVSFAGTAVADADVRRGSRCRGDADLGFIASLGPFVCSGNSTLDRAGAPQGAAWLSRSDLGFNKLTVSFYDHDRFILGVTVQPFVGGSTYRGATDYETTNATMQCPDGMLVAGVYGQRGSRETFTISMASDSDAVWFDRSKVHPDMALRIVNIGILCRKVAYPGVYMA